MQIGTIWTDYRHEYKDFEFRRVSLKMAPSRAKADDLEELLLAGVKMIFPFRKWTQIRTPSALVHALANFKTTFHFITCLFLAMTPARPLDVSCSFSIPGPLKRSVKLRDAFPLSAPTFRVNKSTVLSILCSSTTAEEWLCRAT